MRILITGHQGLANRGCEALLRSTVAMVRTRCPDARFYVPSLDERADAAQWPQARDHGVAFVPVPQSGAWLRIWARACRLAPGLTAAPWPKVQAPEEWRSFMRQCDAMLAIGGDNYTMDYGLESLAVHVGLTEWALRHGCPSILWGASVGPFDKNTTLGQAMTQHLHRLQAITVRESITAKGLARLLGRGTRWGADRVTQPLLRVVADPAFTLEPEEADWAAHWPKGSAPVLGLNISPLVVDSRSDRKLDEWAGLIRRWRTENRYRVVLVAHVTARDAQGRRVHPLPCGADDAEILDGLMARLSGVDGVTQLPAWNAAQLKHAIAQCDLFIGARTHAVIAALSSGVPAMALAYSHKARGIHRDLFGHEYGVIPAQRLNAPTLDQALTDLQQRAPAERAHLQRMIPQWQARARQALQVLPDALHVSD